MPCRAFQNPPSTFLKPGVMPLNVRSGRNVQFGTGRGPAGAAGDEDHVRAPVGVDEATPLEIFDHGRVETAPFGQEPARPHKR